jgi:hypothetical protein
MTELNLTKLLAGRFLAASGYPYLASALCALTIVPSASVPTIAEDCEINDDLLADGVELPDGGVQPGFFGLPSGGLFEEYLIAVLTSEGAPSPPAWAETVHLTSR